MAIVRTPLGTAKNKNTSLDLTIENANITAPASVVVGCTWLTAGGKAIVFLDEKEFGDPMITVVDNGLRTSLWRIFTSRSGIRDIFIEWHDGSRPSAKAAFATAFSEAGRLDKESSNTFLSTTDPGTGALQTTLNVAEAFVAAMGSKGPESDTAGTPQLSYTTGQRDGTIGAPPESNVTIHELYKIVTGTEDTRGKLVGATARAWSCVLATFSQLIPKHISDINGCIGCPYYDTQPPGNPQPLCIEPSVIANSSSPGDRIVPTQEYLFNFPTFCPLEDQ